jgi:hypothetical protein
MAYAEAGKYLQRAVRVNGRVRTEYYGSGPYAADLAAMDAIIRRRRREERLKRVAVETEHRKLLDEETDRGRAIRQMVDACLSGLGFVRYVRNPWRKRMRSPPPDGHSCERSLGSIAQKISAGTCDPRSHVVTLRTVSSASDSDRHRPLRTGTGLATGRQKQESVGDQDSRSRGSASCKIKSRYSWPSTPQAHS